MALTTAEIVSLIVAVIMQSGTALKAIEDIRAAAQDPDSHPAEILAWIKEHVPHVHAAISAATAPNAAPEFAALPDPHGAA